MKIKLLLLLLILPLIHGGAFAQASLEVSAGAILNNPSPATGQATQDFYYSLAGGYRIDKFALNLSVFGDPSKQNPKQPTRGSATATFRFLDSGDWNFTVGAGGYKFGNEVGGFGAMGMSYKNFEAWGRVGSQSFTEAEAFYPVFKTERLRIGPTFLFSRMENIQTVQRAGLKLTLQ